MTDQYFVFDDIDIDVCNEILKNKTMKQKMLNKKIRRMMRKQEIKLKEIRIQGKFIIIENYF